MGCLGKRPRLCGLHPLLPRNSKFGLEALWEALENDYIYGCPVALASSLTLHIRPACITLVRFVYMYNLYDSANSTDSYHKGSERFVGFIRSKMRCKSGPNGCVVMTWVACYCVACGQTISTPLKVKNSSTIQSHFKVIQFFCTNSVESEF